MSDSKSSSSSSSSSEYYTADEEGGYIFEDFFLYTSSDGTKWYLPCYSSQEEQNMILLKCTQVLGRK